MKITYETGKLCKGNEQLLHDVCCSRVFVCHFHMNIESSETVSVSSGKLIEKQFSRLVSLESLAAAYHHMSIERNT